MSEYLLAAIVYLLASFTVALITAKDAQADGEPVAGGAEYIMLALFALAWPFMGALALYELVTGRQVVE